MIQDMNPIERNLKLLSGSSFFVDNIELKPFTLREIIDYGYMKYNQSLNILTFNIQDLINDTDIDYSNLTQFEVVLSSGNDDLISDFIKSLKFFLRKETFMVHQKYGLIFNDSDKTFEESIIVNKDNFKEISTILNYQNYLAKENKEYKPSNDKAKSVIDRLKKYSDIVKKKKQVDGEDNNVDFSDIVSAISTKSNTYNKHTVWDLTIYQLYDEYKRLELISGYETSVMALMQGAKIDLKHWSSKID